jgi:hypothetical protein
MVESSWWHMPVDPTTRWRSSIVHTKGSALQLFELFHQTNVIFMVIHSLWLLITNLWNSLWNHINSQASWALILHEYNFNIIHTPGRVNWYANVLNQNPSSTRKIPLGFIAMVMWIWRQYEDGMLLNTFVPYWGVMGMYLKLVWMMGIPMMWPWSWKAMVP